ncbi:Uncharacterised protein [Mycobacteroides abscessus subsp. abscessus]|nr:Uncharacterised protein [Mycobacteroides abscessus subsp. abscessus]
MTTPISEVATLFDNAALTIKDTVRKIQESEYQLFYTDDGQVFSRKSVMDWVDDNPLTGLTRSLSVEKARRDFQAALQGALYDIWTADLEYNARIGQVLETLPESVRQALVPVPTDPDLARILRENQVDASDRTVIFPSGELLATLRAIMPDIQPKAMTQEEAQVEDLLRHPRRSQHGGGKRLSRSLGEGQREGPQ